MCANVNAMCPNVNANVNANLKVRFQFMIIDIYLF